MLPRRGPHESTLTGASEHGEKGRGSPRMALALALVWSREEPERVGEVVVVPPAAPRATFSVGRATDAREDGVLPLLFARLRPSTSEVTGPLGDPRISRHHLLVRAAPGDALDVELAGRGDLVVGGQMVERATVHPGDLVEAHDRFILLVTRRPLAWSREPAIALYGPAGLIAAPFPFGQADAHGIVGESPEAWQLRQEIAFAATRDEHTLVHGLSGSGKELVVRAIHAASKRGPRALVARNAATIPESLIDAELFGNLRNYPNPGMPDRPGLLGEADEASLFLDEIGELPVTLQARLLRVMDSGEYQRLGEARRRTTRIRLFGATNRDLSALKHDLLARFGLRVHVPGLDERREDVPLLARHLVHQLVAADAALRARLDAGNEPRFSPQLARVLLQHPYTTHARELAELLLRSLAASPRAELERPPGTHAPEPVHASDAAAPNLTREQLLAALERAGGVRDRAWRELGLSSRYQLKRLLKRHNLV